MCRELTKRFEEVVRGRAEEVASRFAEAPKGEITLVLGAGGEEPDSTAAVEAVAELVARGCRAAGRRTSSRGSRAHRATSSTAVLCSQY